MKAVRLHFNRVAIVTFQTQSARVQKQNNKKWLNPINYGAHCKGNW